MFCRRDRECLLSPADGGGGRGRVPGPLRRGVAASGAGRGGGHQGAAGTQADGQEEPTMAHDFDRTAAARGLLLPHRPHTAQER